MKNQITSKFNKDSFVIEPMGVDGGIDPHIIDFILKLNQSRDIMTIFSCEGHHEGDSAYLYFNVSEKGWDKFWLGVMPELSDRFLTRLLGSNALHQLDWVVSVKDNEYNTGIAIHTDLISFDDGHYNWENKKKMFWKTLEETFLKYFLQV